MNNVIILVFVFGLILVSVLIGFWGKKMATTSQAFLGATKMFGPVMVALSSLSAMASGNAMVGVPGAIYGGNGVMNYWILCSCIFAMAYFMIGKRVRALAEIGQVATLGDLCDLRFNSPAIKACFSIVLFLGCVAYLAVQIVAGSSLFTFLLGWDVLPAALLVFGLVTVYTALSGEVGGILTQAFQGVIMLIGGVIIISYFLVSIGGFGNVFEAVASVQKVSKDGFEKIFSPDLVGANGLSNSSAILAAFFIPILGTMGQPQTISRMYALKDPRDLPRMGLYVGIMHLPVALLSISLAFSALYLVASGKIAPLAANDSATWTVGAYIGVAGQICIYTTVVAAIISSATVYLQASANYISKDLPSAFGKKFDDKTQITVTRATIGIVGVVVVILTVFWKQGIGMLTTFGWGTLMSATFPVLITGVLWKRANRAGVLAGIVTALLGNLVCFVLLRAGFVFPGGLPWYVIVIALAMAVSIFGSLFTGKPDRNELSPKVEAVFDL
jgi:Na+/proline symporter